MVFTVIPYYFFLLQLTHCRTALQCVYRASSLDRLRAKPCANKPNYFIAFLTVKLLTSPTNIDPDTKTCTVVEWVEISQKKFVRFFGSRMIVRS